MTDDYLALNRAMWDSRAAAHAGSVDYDVERFHRDPAAISDVVRFDLPRLGDVTGLDTAHLQCHIGTDTLSLHRLGARVTGLDLSPASLEQARRLATVTGADISYVEADAYDAVAALGATYDLVYTGIGAIIWLPSIDRWAEVVAELLRPGGRLFIREGHPMLGTLEPVDGRAELTYPYFEHEDPLVFDGDETYVDTDEQLESLPSHEWQHGIGEILTAVLRHGLVVESFTEHDSVPWRALQELMEPHPDHPGEFRLADRPERLAASFTLTARKPG
ncbi:bifunctional 2-polyprenyl-6-hydroxyphenol methylase/3-demethylubiquinol 3-O-methyltransferase UbiG [Aeromicrobium sp. Leaf350]|uniref:class I SAM-dependent methyltransferase n=1 Tax=Aeromicrobium sp. Leaf350 TaxID=2876565 RepID=UPI001E458FE7|nr:class I SAM-dependent methyltransferase [Aeromicrobium sp. Leaf350]